jgi:ribonuclease P protein component
MLPKKNRIRENVDFGVICRYGKTFSGKSLVLKVSENKLDLVRMGVSVGLKFSSKAVIRNRIKRQIRAFFCQNLEKIQSGRDFVVILGKGWDAQVNPGGEIKQILVKNSLFKE